MIERKKYGALGWNGSLSYEFNDTDYDICQTQLRVYLDQYEEVPFTVLRLLTAYINYGGRITDDKDMRTAEVIMNGFYKADVLTTDYAFSLSGLYINPEYDADGKRIFWFLDFLENSSFSRIIGKTKFFSFFS